ncbi:hypothetical protein JOL79_16810 [Microbispora sp. RL4-1S]|uniref:Uncharacterized protein n=1 Tax=Microbispora oryzae TaxID=2806554 RepID=A0A940WR60_9ACTN|nr:hypothetical protein [Microbispora oryzae]MBP2705474.1 hypothetical protein [Microbispora oryzae]
MTPIPDPAYEVETRAVVHHYTTTPDSASFVDQLQLWGTLTAVVISVIALVVAVRAARRGRASGEASGEK